VSRTRAFSVSSISSREARTISATTVLPVLRGVNVLR
jgi:hypothetical protein